MIDSVRHMLPIPCNGFGCNECGLILKKGDLACICADCGAVFCERCVKNDALDAHCCEAD